MKEWQLVSLIGPTHHYSGLASGNRASIDHRHCPSYPREGALQMLSWMETLLSLGVPLYFLPPLFPREAKNNTIEVPALSSAYIWCANIGTFTPSCDARDGRARLSLANLSSNYHRSFEGKARIKMLQTLFQKCSIELIAPYPRHQGLFCEGAANHIRFCPPASSHPSLDLQKGLHLFVYGFEEHPQEECGALLNKPSGNFTPRQSAQAQRWIAALHKIEPSSLIFAKQCPEAIHQGIFHNDVISTGHEQLFFLHEESFVAQKKVLEQLQERFFDLFEQPLAIEWIDRSRLTLDEAVTSYFFNSQIVTSYDRQGKRAGNVLLTPIECQINQSAAKLCEEIVARNLLAIADWKVCDLTQSMQGGGGPACLRLRMPLTTREAAGLDPRAILSEEKIERLRRCVMRYWPEKLHIEQLFEQEEARQLHQEAKRALLELYQALDLEELVP